MKDFIWFDIFIGVLQWSGFIFTGCIFALMCFMQAAKIYDKIKQECNIEKLLDTPQKERDELMEGNTTYCYPQDEGPLTRICPVCGALYPAYKVICSDDQSELQPFRKTEPLPTIAKLNTLIQDINDAEQQFENELEMIRTALEEKAYEYNKKRPYTFTEQETLSLYNLYNKVREQSHEEKRAS